jgi:hypothetical protein
MRTVWAAVGLALVVLAAEAHADTLYLKDGQTVWGTEVVEEGETAVVLRPGEALRFPMRDVSRIERSRLSIPRYFEPPTSGVTPVGDRVIQPPVPPAAGAGASLPAQGPATAGGSAGPPTAVVAPTPLTPTRLPAPPPPPSAAQPR